MQAKYNITDTWGSAVSSLSHIVNQQHVLYQILDTLKKEIHISNRILANNRMKLIMKPLAVQTDESMHTN